jgi:N6-adenosine-specific RNA methylase IME4
MTPPRHESRALLLDPPWDPQTWSVRGKGRHPSAYYDVMSLDEIAALPVRDYAAKDGTVWLWMPGQFVVRGVHVELFRAWGCIPSSMAIVWVKTAKRLGNQLPLFLIADNKEFPKGQGLTTREGAEVCFLARYGKLGRADKGVAQVILAPRRAPSQKPDEQYPLIERLVGPGKYVEFSARQRRPRWDCVYSPEADTGPGKRRWRANSYPQPAESRIATAEGDNQ